MIHLRHEIRNVEGLTALSTDHRSPLVSLTKQHREVKHPLTISGDLANFFPILSGRHFQRCMHWRSSNFSLHCDIGVISTYNGGGIALHLDKHIHHADNLRSKSCVCFQALLFIFTSAWISGT